MSEERSTDRDADREQAEVDESSALSRAEVGEPSLPEDSEADGPSDTELNGKTTPAEAGGDSDAVTSPALAEAEEGVGLAESAGPDPAPEAEAAADAPEPVHEMTFTEHLNELRVRLVRCIIAAFVGMLLCYGFSEQLFMMLMKPLLNDEALNAQCIDYKTALQELCQKKYKSAPLYTLCDESGPDHEKTFEVEVTAGNDIRQIGRGKSKKEAQKQAAQKAWESLQSENDA